MATRFYLPATGSPPVTPAAWSTGWEKTAGAVWLPTKVAKSNTALANLTNTGNAVTSTDTAVAGFVSPPLAAGATISGTFSAVVKGLESNANFNGWMQIIIRVLSGDGATVRGTLYAGSTATTASATASAENGEWTTTAATRIKSALALTSVVAQAGDRISIEIGARQASTRSDTITLNFGDPSATADFALTSALTTNLVPWVELSANLTFSAETVTGALAATLPLPALPPRVAYRYYRMRTNAVRARNQIQLSELAFLNAGVRQTGMTITAGGGGTENSGGGEGSTSAGDNSTATKWLHDGPVMGSTYIQYDFGSAVSVDGYRWATANDAPERDPVSWAILGSNDAASWVKLDTKTEFTVTTSRSTTLPDIAFNGGSASFRYYRMQIDASRGPMPADMIQLSELAILNGGARLTGMSASCPNQVSGGGVTEQPSAAADNSTATKWFNLAGDTDGQTIVYDFATPVTADGYRWATGDDFPARDPITWTLDGSNDNTTWTLLDYQPGYNVTNDRSTFLPDFRFAAAPSSLTGALTATGTPALSLPLPGATVSGVVRGDGTLSAASPGPTAAVSGAVRTAGALDSTLPLPGVELSGSLQQPQANGALSATLPAPSAALSGVVQGSGALGSNSPLLSTSVSGTVHTTGFVAASLPLPVADLSGSVQQTQVNGTLAAALPLPTATLVGGVSGSGTLAASSQVPVASVSGTVRGSGALAAALPFPSSSLSAVVRSAGALAADLPSPALSAAGTPRSGGALASSIPLPSSAFAGGIQASGSVAASLPFPTAALTGGTRTAGPLAATLPLPTASAIGGVRTAGALSGSLPLPVARIFEDLVASGPLAGMVPMPTAAATGTVKASGFLSSGGLLPTADLSGVTRASGSLAASAPAPVLLVSGSQTIPAVLSAPLPLPVATAAGVVRSTGTLDAVLPAAQSVASGAVFDSRVTGLLAATLPLPVILLLPIQELFSNTAELRLNRYNTRAFISDDPITIELETRIPTRTPSGAVEFSTGPSRPSQTFKLIMQSPAGSSIEQRTEDGTERQIDFILLGSWDATISVGDWWGDSYGNRWEVKAIVPRNGYETRAVIEAHGRDLTGG